VSDPRDAFIEKFRASLRARVQKLRDMLQILEHVPDNPEACAQVRGELHTLKGEARLLGLVRLSELAHTLETVLERIDAETIALSESGLEVMARALSDHLAREDSDALLQTAQDRLGGGSDHSDSPSADAGQAPQPDPRAPESAIPSALGGSSRWIQVDSTLVDELCETMAAISGDFGRLFAQVGRVVKAASALAARGALRQEGSSLIEECARFRAALDNATVRTWELRMVPAQPLLRELAAHAHQLAESSGKSVHVTVDAAGVQIERDALESIWDAMLHLVRNAIDHGVESAAERGDKGHTGILTISAQSVGTSVTLSVEDDGRGIDCELVRRMAIARQLLRTEQVQAMSDDEVVQLVFEQGFSTRETVGALSGRGIGLDVVKTRAEALGGRVDVQTRLGAGTRFSITLPFTLTKERLLIFEFAGGLYALPTQSVLAIVGERDLPARVDGSDFVYRHEGEPVPLLSLAELLGRETETCSAAVIVTLQGGQYGLLVARIVGERELIRRPAEPLLSRTTTIGASAMLEDGRAVLVLDLAQVGRQLRHVTTAGESNAHQGLVSNAIPRVLLVDDSPVIRAMVSEILASAGLAVTTASDGEEALALITKEEPDLIISDVEMPRMDGFALLERVRQRSQRIPVVMLTTRATVQDRQRATTLGANAYVLKADFKSDVLLDVVQRFVPLHR
jgi:chemotaxis protein histidine kinase CheA